MFLCVSGQQLSPHKCNQLSFSEKKSREDEKKTHTPHADVDHPEQPAAVAAEKSLKPGNYEVQTNNT